MIANESASTDSSPDREVITSPVTPTWSPRSTSRFHAASASSPTRASEIITWMSPVPSRSVAKQSFPPIRERITRPATPTVSPVAVSGASDPYLARTSAMPVGPRVPHGVRVDTGLEHPGTLLQPDAYLLRETVVVSHDRRLPGITLGHIVSGAASRGR